jgi:hypothetical protein
VQLEDGTVAYELGSQYTNFFYDMNAEAWGWNREEDESRWSHFKRIGNANFDHDMPDVAFSDLNPTGLMKLNEKIGTDENTYYFSITTGFHDTNNSKPRDLMNIPDKITKMAVGFDIDTEKAIVFDTKRTKKYKYTAAKTFLGRLFHHYLQFIKYNGNPTFAHFSFFFET